MSNADPAWGCDMRCLIQMFDDKGAAQLSGDSRFKDHIGWLTLKGWSFGNASDVSPGASSRSSLSDKEIQLVLRTEDPVVSTLSDAVGGTNWSKGTLDCFKDGEDQTWYLRLTLQDPVMTSLDLGTKPEPGRGSAWPRWPSVHPRSTTATRRARSLTSCRAALSGIPTRRSVESTIRIMLFPDCQNKWCPARAGAA